VPYRLSRSQTLTSVRRVKSAFADWKEIRTEQTTQVFLAVLLMDKKWKTQWIPTYAA